MSATEGHLRTGTRNGEQEKEGDLFICAWLWERFVSVCVIAYVHVCVCVCIVSKVYCVLESVSLVRWNECIALARHTLMVLALIFFPPWHLVTAVYPSPETRFNKLHWLAFFHLLSFVCFFLLLFFSFFSSSFFWRENTNRNKTKLKRYFISAILVFL